MFFPLLLFIWSVTFLLFYYFIYIIFWFIYFYFNSYVMWQFYEFLFLFLWLQMLLNFCKNCFPNLPQSYCIVVFFFTFYVSLWLSSLLTAVYYETIIVGVEAPSGHRAAGRTLVHGMSITVTHAATDLSHSPSTHHSRMALKKMHFFCSISSHDYLAFMICIEVLDCIN